MADIVLQALPLTRERFAPYGDVIETDPGFRAAMNAGRFERFDGLAEVDVEGRAVISIARCRLATALPLRVDSVERHTLGSQAFVPLSGARMLIVVAPPGAGVEASDLRAFATNGRQGVNYHRGTWHMPLIGFEAGQQYLVVDGSGDTPDCEEHVLDDTVLLAES